MTYKDKIKHIIISAILVIIFYLFLPLYLACIFTFLIGLGKEFYDKYIHKTYIDKWDLVADIIGIIVGILLLRA